MKLFTRRHAPPAAPASPPTVEAIFRLELSFIVGALLHFGIALIDVEDMAQEVIGALQRSLPTFDPSRELRPWLYGVAFNIASNHFRREERHRARFIDEPVDEVVSHDQTTTVEEQMIQNELHRTVRHALHEIPLDRRAVLVARVLHGWSELATAEALSIPVGTVKTRLRLAKQDLRDGIKRRERDENRAQSGAFLLPLGVLLTHEGQLPMVPDDMRARLWEKLQRMIAQQSPPTSTPAPANDGDPAPGGSLGPSLPSLPTGLRSLGKSEIGRTIAAAATGGALVFALGPIPRVPAAPAAPTPITREELATLCAVPLAAGAVASAPGSAAPTMATTTTATTTTSAPRAAKPSAPAQVPSSAAEISDPVDSADLLASATVALERRDIATARRLLEQQSHDFPRSKLGISRDLLWVRVLLSEGKRAEARAKAEAIRKAVPNSPMIKTLDALFPSAEPLP